MSQYLNELLQTAEDIGSCFFTPKEAAEMLEVSADLLLDTNSDYYKRYRKGWLQAEFDLRKNIIKLAISGSSPAQTMALDIQQKSKIKILD